jgi:hypothetical protein
LRRSTQNGGEKNEGCHYIPETFVHARLEKACSPLCCMEALPTNEESGKVLG